MTERITLPRLMVAAPASGSGKTTLACALLRAAQRRGLDPCAFKCGPDYIDPMFHRQVLGLPSRNLDLFFSSPEQVRSQMAVGGRGHSLGVIEGVMGLYDGVGATHRASSWHLAQVTDTPVVLVVEPKGAALTLAAQLKGLMDFRSPGMIKAIVLNGCSAHTAGFYASMIQEETGLPVVGCLPRLENCTLSSRHLGLLLPEEIAGLEEKIDRLANQLEETVDVPRLLALASTAPDWTAELSPPVSPAEDAPVVAVARDEAFCFYYQANLEALEQQGMRLTAFSPLRDSCLPPEACGLYLGGGYPELHAAALSGNQPMLDSLRQAIQGGLPTLAECGGFLYLQQSLEDAQGRSWPMAGVLDGEGIQTSGLRRFGYITLTMGEDTPYLKAGEQAAAHEFHRWDSTCCGSAACAVRPGNGKAWNCMTWKGNLLAGFPHLYYPSQPNLVRRFARACTQYKENRRQ